MSAATPGAIVYDQPLPSQGGGDTASQWGGTNVQDANLQTNAGVGEAVGAQSASSVALTGDLVAWYDPSDTSTITDVAGAVSAIANKAPVPIGGPLAQATGANKPTTGTRTLNGLNALDFDGNDELTVNNPDIPSPFTWATVFASDTGNDGLDRNLDSEYNIFVDGATNHIFTAGFSSGNIDSGVLIGTATHVVIVVNDGASSSIQVDGVRVTGTLTGSLTHYDLGALGSITAALDGRHGEVRVYNRALSPAEVNTLEAELTAKWVGSATPQGALVVKTAPVLLGASVATGRVLAAPAVAAPAAPVAPVAQLITARGIPQPVQSASVIPGSQVTAPAAPVQPWASTTQAQNIPQPVPEAQGVTVGPQVAPVAVQPRTPAIQNQLITPVPQRSPGAFVALTPGTAPVATPPGAPVIQAQAIPVRPQLAPGSFVALTPGTAPVTTVPVARLIQSVPFALPRQQSQVLSAPRAVVFAAAPAFSWTVRTVANIGQPLKDARVWIALTPGTAPPAVVEPTEEELCGSGGTDFLNCATPLSGQKVLTSSCRVGGTQTIPH